MRHGPLGLLGVCSPSPAGMWAGGGRDDRGGVRSLPGPRTAPKAFLPPCGAGASLCAHQQPPPWHRKSGRARVPPGPGVFLRVLSVRLLSALQSPCLSRSPACPGNREPRPLCHRRTTVSVMSPRRRTRGRRTPCWTKDGHGPPESRPRRAPREDSGRGTRGSGESSLFSGGRGGKLWAPRLRAAWSAGPPRREGRRPPHGRGLATHHVWLRLGVLWGFIFIPLIFFS